MLASKMKVVNRMSDTRKPTVPEHPAIRSKTPSWTGNSCSLASAWTRRWPRISAARAPRFMRHYAGLRVRDWSACAPSAAPLSPSWASQTAERSGGHGRRAGGDVRRRLPAARPSEARGRVGCTRARRRHRRQRRLLPEYRLFPRHLFGLAQCFPRSGLCGCRPYCNPIGAGGWCSSAAG